jgi:hypothetical protein
MRGGHPFDCNGAVSARSRSFSQELTYRWVEGWIASARGLGGSGSLGATILVGVMGGLAHCGLNPSSISCTAVAECVCCRSLEGVDLIGGIAYDGVSRVREGGSIAVVCGRSSKQGQTGCLGGRAKSDRLPG